MQTLTVQTTIDEVGRIKLDVPTDLPAGRAEVVLVVNPLGVASAARRYDFRDLTGRLTWQGDAVAEQRRLRDEW